MCAFAQQPGRRQTHATMLYAPYRSYFTLPSLKFDLQAIRGQVTAEALGMPILNDRVGNRLDGRKRAWNRDNPMIPKLQSVEAN